MRKWRRVYASLCVAVATTVVLSALSRDVRSTLMPFYNETQKTSLLFDDSSDRVGHFDGLFSDARAYQNIEESNQHRQKYEAKCADESSTQEEIVEILGSWYRPSLDGEVATQQSKLPVEPCRFTFLDFGANVGDSMGKLVDAGIPPCSKKGILAPRIDLEHGFLQPLQKGKGFRKLITWIRTQMEEVSRQLSGPVQPENYCYFGIEGNPIFTNHLNRLQQRLMLTSPRPLRRVHFFTETVGAAKDETTVLFLDTVNEKENFWGSSTLSGHRDVQSSLLSGNDKREVSVQGFTLTRLLHETVKMMPGAHVMVKMDIEGAEYALLNEAFDSGALCNTTARAVRVDIIVEVHGEVSENRSYMNRYPISTRSHILSVDLNRKKLTRR
jgi:hypothetical protein